MLSFSATSGPQKKGRKKSFSGSSDATCKAKVRSRTPLRPHRCPRYPLGSRARREQDPEGCLVELGDPLERYGPQKPFWRARTVGRKDREGGKKCARSRARRTRCTSLTLPAVSASMLSHTFLLVIESQVMGFWKIRRRNPQQECRRRRRLRLQR